MMKRVQSEAGTVQWWMWCPGCETHHAYTTAYAPGTSGPTWTMTGTPERATFSPSLLVNGSTPDRRCHLYVRDGMVEFLADCYHKLAGKTVPVEPPAF